MTFSFVSDLDLSKRLFSFQMINELLADKSDNSNSQPESVDDGHAAGAAERQSVTADDGGTVEQGHSKSQVSPCDLVLDDSTQPCSDDPAPPLCDSSPMHHPVQASLCHSAPLHDDTIEQVPELEEVPEVSLISIL